MYISIYLYIYVHIYTYSCIQHLREADFPATPSPSSRGHYLGTRYVYVYLCIIVCARVRT